MSQYKIHIKNTKDTEINQYKDFSKLKDRYQVATNPLYRTPLYLWRNRKLVIGILVIAVILGLVIYESSKEPETKETIKSTINK